MMVECPTPFLHNNDRNKTGECTCTVYNNSISKSPRKMHERCFFHQNQSVKAAAQGQARKILACSRRRSEFRLELLQRIADNDVQSRTPVSLGMRFCEVYARRDQRRVASTLSDRAGDRGRIRHAAQTI